MFVSCRFDWVQSEKSIIIRVVTQCPVSIACIELYVQEPVCTLVAILPHVCGLLRDYQSL